MNGGGEQDQAKPPGAIICDLRGLLRPASNLAGVFPAAQGQPATAGGRSGMSAEGQKEPRRVPGWLVIAFSVLALVGIAVAMLRGLRQVSRERFAVGVYN